MMSIAARVLTVLVAVAAAGALRKAVERESIHETIESAVWLVCAVLLTR